MKRICLLLLLLPFATGCHTGESERKLELREAELARKEQALLQKEKMLQLRDSLLTRRELALDSTFHTAPQDTGIYKGTLVGRWAVHMACTETDCPGAAVGDTKTEHWDISYQQENVLAKAIVNNQLERVYSGTYNGQALVLTAQPGTAAPAATMRVRLEETADGHLEGTREIIRPDACRTVYEVSMVKQSPNKELP